MAGSDEIFSEADVAAEGELAPEETAAPQVDYAALEARAAEVKPGMTLDRLIDSYKEAESALARNASISDQYTRLKSEYDVARPLIQRIKEDPQFAAGLTQWTRDYYEGSPVESQAPELGRALDPLAHKIQELEINLTTRELKDQLSQLKQDPNYGKYINSDVERQMWERVSETGITDMNAHFWTVAGPKALAEAQKAASKQAAEEIQRGHKAYSPLDGSSAPRQAAQTGDSSPDDVIAEIAKLGGW